MCVLPVHSGCTELLQLPHRSALFSCPCPMLSFPLSRKSHYFKMQYAHNGIGAPAPTLCQQTPPPLLKGFALYQNGSGVYPPPPMYQRNLRCFTNPPPLLT